MPYLMDPLDSFQVDVPDDVPRIERLILACTTLVREVDLSQVRLLAVDFDGVLTDNRVLVDQCGSESVWCDRSDGWGIARLKDAGVEVVVISTETNPVVQARCRKLKIECIQGCDNKLASLQEVVRKHSLTSEQVAYVGNDVNDLECMRWVGISVAVADAVRPVRAISSLVTARTGGKGAVREVAEWILAASGKNCRC